MSIAYYFKRLEHRCCNFRNRNKAQAAREKLRSLLYRGGTSETRSIVFVCTGNICRSAYAHYALKDRLVEAGIDNVSVSSAGIATTPGKKADSTAKKVALKRDVDLSPHLTSFIYRDELSKASVILVMEPVHARRVLSIEPGVADKVILAGLLASESQQAIVDDPYGQSTEVFNACFDRLDEVIDRILTACTQ